MTTILNRFSKYSIVILGFLTITLSHAQDDRADDISILDVDANGEVDALTDGLLLLRSMFGLTDDVLIAGVVSSDATVSDSAAIDSYITSIKDKTYGELNVNDDQNISGSSLSGTVLTIGIENGSSETVDLSSLEDGIGVSVEQANAIADNTAKTGITSAQATAITVNTTKTGITSDQANAITANTAKSGITSAQAAAITVNTTKTGITSDQANAITANTAKTGITSAQTVAVDDNTAKTGITSDQASAITDNSAKTGVTSAQAAAIDDNTAKTGITSGQASAITDNSAKTGITPAQAAAVDNNTTKTGITSDQATLLTNIERGLKCIGDLNSVLLETLDGVSDVLDASAVRSCLVSNGF